MESIKVSVIITTYGGDWKLIRAITSVLEQDYQNFEIIVVDDNQPESKGRIQTEYYIREFANEKKVRYIKHEFNKNGAAARNTGIREAQGDFIAFLDDDDYYLKDRLSASLRYLENNPTCDGVCASVMKLKSGSIAGLVKNDGVSYLTPRDLIINQNILGTGSNIFVRRSSIEAIDGFDERFERFQDVEFMIRFCEKYKVGFLDKILMVKDIAGYRVPSYEKIKISLKMFCDKFKKEIESLNNSDRKEFWEDRYSYLFSLAMQGKDKNAVKESAVNLGKIRMLTSKEKKCVRFFEIIKLVIQLRKQVAEKDMYIVKLYREKKNNKKYKDIILALKDNEQINKAYYYRYIDQ